eukprot:3385224-Alexandrium_andersonii.AAC.1
MPSAEKDGADGDRAGVFALGNARNPPRPQGSSELGRDRGRRAKHTHPQPEKLVAELAIAASKMPHLSPSPA